MKSGRILPRQISVFKGQVHGLASPGASRLVCASPCRLRP